MPKTYLINEQQKEEIETQLKATKDAKLYKKIQVLNYRAQGYKNSKIAELTGYSKSRVSALACEYAKNGIEYFLKEHRQGGNNRNLSYEEEKALLKTFEEQATKGYIITIDAIRQAYDAACGKETAYASVYYMLERHGWRKLMPRSKHPNKASDEAIKASKKLTPLSREKWKILTQEK